MRRMRAIRAGERSDPAALRDRIAREEYVVDEHAVAEAMLSRMLVPAQLFGRRAVGPDQHDAGSGLDGSEPGDR